MLSIKIHTLHSQVELGLPPFRRFDKIPSSNRRSKILFLNEWISLKASGLGSATPSGAIIRNNCSSSLNIFTAVSTKLVFSLRLTPIAPSDRSRVPICLSEIRLGVNTIFTDDWKKSGSVLEKPSGLEAHCKSDNKQHKSVPIRGVRKAYDNSFWDIGKVTTNPPSNHAENEAGKIEPKSTRRRRLIFDILIKQQGRILG